MNTPAARFGDQLSTKREQPGSGKIQMGPDGVIMLTRIWQVDTDYRWSEMPYPRQPDTEFNELFCVDVQVEPSKGKHTIMTATFQGFKTLPPVIYEFQNSRMDRPIQLHPDFGKIPGMGELQYRVVDEKQGGAFIKFFDGTNGEKNNKFRGIEAYIVGSASFRRTEFAIEPDFSQTAVGKLQVPDAGPWASKLPDPLNAAHSWLLVENSCSNLLKGASILWQRVRVWQYNQLGWMPEIYSP